MKSVFGVLLISGPRVQVPGGAPRKALNRKIRRFLFLQGKRACLVHIGPFHAAVKFRRFLFRQRRSPAVCAKYGRPAAFGG